MTAVSLSFECRLFFARLSFDRRSTVVRPSLSTGNELERVLMVMVVVMVVMMVVTVVTVVVMVMVVVTAVV